MVSIDFDFSYRTIEINVYSVTNKLTFLNYVFEQIVAIFPFKGVHT